MGRGPSPEAGWVRSGVSAPGVPASPDACPAYTLKQIREEIDDGRKKNIGPEILDGIRELKAGEAGRVVNAPSVAEVREKTGLSQTRFAALLGVPVRTLQDWEQGRRAPSGAARTLLLIAYRNPEALLEVA